MLSCDLYLMPETLEEAFDLFEAHDGSYRIVAGATDILPWARDGRAGDVHYPVLVDISRIPDLTGFRELTGGRVRLGAATPFQRFLTEDALKRHLPVMPHVAVWFADDQIRESATLGGNIVNASPAADGTPPVIALNGTMELASREGGVRRMPITEFVTGPGRTQIAKGELLVAIECDSAAGYGAAFEKVGHRRSLVISTVCVAALVKLDAAMATVEDIRLSLAGVGPVPVRLAECEALLKGRAPDAALVEQAASLPVDRVQSRTRQAYRREVVRNFVYRGIADALADAGLAIDRDATPLKEAANG
ncbi:MAG: molybdopterin dehydrogenase [Alphaproteobacteria bacterium]|nr:molybdopterin dehydrogenase [Alphaproteobacteria bacterium]